MKDSRNNVTAISTDTQKTSEAIAHQWMADSAHTANTHDFDSHMDLISKKVAVRGVPDVELVDYDAWEKQCRK
jgi:2-polyprenyl-3-methyl-5-hydroxy-6-metoxy-1,4-benzoquinol methylase